MLAFSSHQQQHPAAAIATLPFAASRQGFTTTQVRSVSLDSLVARYCVDADLPIVVKLDVEGAENAAIEGASGTLRERDVMLIYEDHGRDAESTVSSYLAGLGLLLFAVEAGACLRCVSVAEISAMKVNPHRGYNFAACAPTSAFLPLITSRDLGSGGAFAPLRS